MQLCSAVECYHAFFILRTSHSRELFMRPGCARSESGSAQLYVRPRWARASACKLGGLTRLAKFLMLTTRFLMLTTSLLLA